MREVMIYLPGMTHLIALIVAVALAQAAAGTPGPWKSLFDGKTMDAWKIFKSEAVPKQCEPGVVLNCWLVKDGELWKDGNAKDMVTKEQFGDFELEL